MISKYCSDCINIEEVLYGKKTKKGPRVSPERRDWVRKESQMIYTRNLVHRDKVLPVYCIILAMNKLICTSQSKLKVEEENNKLIKKVCVLCAQLIWRPVVTTFCHRST